jgi:hypothetical protein
MGGVIDGVEEWCDGWSGGEIDCGMRCKGRNPGGDRERLVVEMIETAG